VKAKRAASGKPVDVRVGSFSSRIYSTPVRGKERFTLAWTDPVHGRRRETFGDFESAKRRGEHVARNLQNGDTEAAGFTGAERARFVAILEALRPTGVPAEVAAAQYAEAHGILKGRSVVDAAREYARRHRTDLPAVTVSDAVAEFIQDRTKAKASARYLSDLRSRLSRGFAAKNVVNLGDLTPDCVRMWLDSETGGTRNYNNNFSTVRTLIRYCIGRGWLPKDCDLLDGLKKRKSGSSGIAIWTPEELAALLSNCPTRAIPALAICAFSGLRNAEVLRSDWREIKMSEGFVEVPATKAKTASRRLAPCPANLAAWLTPHAKAEGPLWPANEATLHEDFRRAAAAAGLKWRDNALRHSFVSYRLADVQDVARVALEAGNSPSMIFQHYRELVRPADGARWFQIRPDRVSTDADHPALSLEPGANGR
jgi:integrase